MKYLQIKQPTEEFVLTVDFTKNLLASGESISWVGHATKVSKRIIAGTPDDSTDVVQTALTSDGAALVSLRRGTHGNFYRIRVLASTNLNAIWEEDLILPVWNFEPGDA